MGIKKNLRAHGKLSKNKDFDPLRHALGLIRKHFDAKAYMTHSRANGQPIIRYRLTTGKKEVVGHGDHARLVLFSYDKELNASAARQLCQDLDLC